MALCHCRPAVAWRLSIDRRPGSPGGAGRHRTGGTVSGVRNRPGALAPHRDEESRGQDRARGVAQERAGTVELGGGDPTGGDQLSADLLVAGESLSGV